MAFDSDNMVPFEGNIHKVAWRSLGEDADGSEEYRWKDYQQVSAAVGAERDENIGPAGGSPAKAGVGLETEMDILHLHLERLRGLELGTEEAEEVSVSRQHHP